MSRASREGRTVFKFDLSLSIQKRKMKIMLRNDVNFGGLSFEESLKYAV